MSKTQILLTNVNKVLFQEGWARDLESKLFDQEFPHLRSKVSYYSPLPFLNRIVIIFKDEASANRVYDYLVSVDHVPEHVKVYLSESLLSQRSNSESDTGKISGRTVNGNKPILSLNTTEQDGNLTSPTLSPDRAGSPTLLKFDENSEYHRYQEPLPKNEKQPIQVGTRCLWKDVGQPMSPSITLDEFEH